MHVMAQIAVGDSISDAGYFLEVAEHVVELAGEIADLIGPGRVDGLIDVALGGPLADADELGERAAATERWITSASPIASTAARSTDDDHPGAGQSSRRSRPRSTPAPT